MVQVLDICVCHVMIKSGNNQDSGHFYVYSGFLKSAFIFLYVFNACEYVCGRQRKTCRSQLPPSTLWVLGTKPR